MFVLKLSLKTTEMLLYPSKGGDLLFQTDFQNGVHSLGSKQGRQNTLFEIIQYQLPRQNQGGQVIYNGDNVVRKNQTLEYYGQYLRQVRIGLQGGGIYTQPGALHFMNGDIHMEVRSGLKNLFRGMGTGESAATPHYQGSHGEIYLEPSYKHYFFLELNNEEALIDNGMFYCCEDSIALGAHTHKNVGVGLFGGEGFRQPKLTGTGLAILESPVPREEILVYPLNDDTLKVDGNYALVVKGKIETSIEKSSKSWLGSLKSGEGVLHCYRGSGEVWLAPALKHEPLYQ